MCRANEAQRSSKAAQAGCPPPIAQLRVYYGDVRVLAYVREAFAVAIAAASHRHAWESPHRTVRSGHRTPPPPLLLWRHGNCARLLAAAGGGVDRREQPLCAQTPAMREDARFPFFSGSRDGHKSVWRALCIHTAEAKVPMSVVSRV